MKERTKYIELAFTNKKDAEHTLTFKSIYIHKGMLLGAEKKELKDIFKDGLQKCRFCGKNENETTFSQITHVIPQLLKRARPYSNFECDECNHKFSKYETDFSNYYLLHRAMFGHRKKSSGLAKLKMTNGVEIQGLHKTKEDLKKLKISDEEIEQILNSNQNMVRLLANDDDDGIQVLDNGKTLKISFVRPPYTPLNVYRTILKIALSLIPQNEFYSFKSMLNILNGNYKDLDPTLFSFIQYALPKYNSYFNVPIVTQWDKIDHDVNHPQKLFALYLDNKIIQIPIFSDSDFNRMYTNKESFQIMAIPPIVNPIVLINDKPDIEFHKELSNLTFSHIDLSSIEKVNDDIDEVTVTKDENIRVETKNISIIKSEFVQESIDEQRWGFNLFPEFNEFNKTDLKIIFDLLIQIDDNSHVYMKSGSFYQIENLNKANIGQELDLLEDLVSSSMEHTYRMFLQQFPEYKEIPVKSFSKKFFNEHIVNHLREQKIINEPEKKESDGI